ncbi:type II secretion system F family protein [Agromyces larvae]|uniref:Type II secretion system F family protein n=1 Tax=Agromyces larvae TaxID=2929802 RepID=A0ABY4C6L1_9MICO|nr:type II secretion system F family protein [Agromyces larvae]UOE44350.1 type II secretion system F family protein [Agromyces larvae]
MLNGRGAPGGGAQQPGAGPLARLRRARPDEAAGFEAVAVVAERLAVMLAAGVPAASVWRHLDDAATGVAPAAGVAAAAGAAATAGVAEAAGAAAAAGHPVGEAIARAAPDGPTRAAWSTLAAAWHVAESSGAPLAASLRDLAGALRDEAQARRDVRAALAGPRASARLVTALPLIAIGFGALLGFDTIGVLLGSPIGLVCLAVGGALLWAGARWNAALARRAAPERPSPGLELDLLAVAMSGGGSLERSRESVASAIERYVPAAVGIEDVDGTVRLASSAGAPVADLLRSEAARRRRQARSDAVVRAAALSVRLMLPLGACVLPAFVLLGVAPLMISVVTGTLGAA